MNALYLTSYGMGVPFHLYVTKEMALAKPEDLKGKRIGVFGGASGTTTNTFFAACIAYLGFDPRTDAEVPAIS
mgnify:CR=1 FL=1